MLVGYNLDFRTTKSRMRRESHHPPPRGSQSETPVDIQGFEGQPLPGGETEAQARENSGSQACELSKT